MTPCPHCRSWPRIVPTFGGFATRCDCPPVQTITSNNTPPIIRQQERLGPEFERVLHDNLWELLAR